MIPRWSHSSDILAVECDCKAGSKDKDRVVCVHNLPVVYKVTEIMLEAMSEHMLLELTPCINKLSENWTADTMCSIQHSVMILMEAAGEVVSEEEKTNVSIDDLLGRFLTGTEKVKAWGNRGVAGKVSKPGPITELCLDSPAKKANDQHVNETTRMRRERQVERIICKPPP